MQSQCLMKERDHYSGTFNATIHIVCGGGGADLSSFTPFTPSWSLGGIMTIASQNWQLSIALHCSLSTKKAAVAKCMTNFGLHEATETFWDAMELSQKTVQMLFLPRKLPKIANILFIILWAIELFWRWRILGCDMHLSFLKSTFRLEIVSWVAELKCTALVVRSFKLAPKVHERKPLCRRNGWSFLLNKMVHLCYICKYLLSISQFGLYVLWGVQSLNLHINFGDLQKFNA
jgi:hypothetical protein